MVSPRKRVLQANTSRESGTPPNLTQTPFSKFRFFLDLKSTKESGRSSLVSEILLLGGHVEEFFSAQATHVITDLPEEQIPTASSSQSGSNLGPAPLSPWTPSPVTPATPISNRRLGPSSRAEAILSKVKQTAKVVNTVLEKAVQLQIQIWSYSKILAWLQKYHLKVGRHHQRYSDSKLKASGLKTLVSPCIKLESAVESSKPYFFELKSWPSLHFEGRPGSSPFSSSAARAKTKKLAKRLDISTEIKKKEEAPPKPKRTRGFCEICNENFEGLELHLATESHVNFVNAASNWTEVDQFVTAGSGGLA